MSENTIEQLPLSLSFRPALGREDFLVSECNQEAIGIIDQWPHWDVPAIVIHGPKGSGKTHLMHVWRNLSDALLCGADIDKDDFLTQIQSGTVKAIAVEDAHILIKDETWQDFFFHVYNTMKNNGGHILFLSNVPLSQLDIPLPDLRSRMLACPHIAIHAPDDEALSGLVVKLFKDKGLTLSPDVLNYCMMRMDRSFEAAQNLVGNIDRLSLSQKRRITIPLIKKLFEF